MHLQYPNVIFDCRAALLPDLEWIKTYDWEAILLVTSTWLYRRQAKNFHMLLALEKNGEAPFFTMASDTTADLGTRAQRRLQRPLTGVAIRLAHGTWPILVG